MSGYKRYDSVKKRNSSTHRESQSLKKDYYVKDKRMKLERTNCPIKASYDNETEGLSTKVSDQQEEKCRRESMYPSQIIGNSSCYGSSTSICNQSSNNTGLDTYKDKVTNTNLQNDKDTDFTLSLSSAASDNPSCIAPSSSRSISPVSTKSMIQNFESSCSFGKNLSSRDVSPISRRSGSHSPNSNLVQPQNDDFINLQSQNVGNSNKSLIANEFDNNLSHSNSFKHGNADSVNANTNYFFTKEGELLHAKLSLRHFNIIDELEESDQEEGEVMGSNSEESGSELSEELPADEIDEMLDEGLPENLKSSKDKECTVKMRQKVVLEEIGHNHFDLLPEGWIQIMHSSGMPVYLNQKSRVCTMSRPYYLGPGSSRNHNVPLSAIPCLHYRRASELDKKNKEEIEKKKQLQNDQSQSEIELMSAEIETFEENKATQSLEASELHEYCKKAFKFKTLNLIPFKSWADRRKYVKMRREMQGKQRPTLPGGTKLLKFPIRNPDGSVSKSKGEWIINPNGKSYVCILHEYVQHALKKHPKYQFKELENPATPYSATVFIEDIKYGFGMGASKKQAKVEAAKAALEVLIPGMKDKIEPDSQFGTSSGTTKRSNDNDISIFDQIKVEDPRVAEFCAKSTEPPPYAILLTCLGRNTGVGEIELSYVMNPKSFKQDEFTMSVGSHKATVACRNKREGKQRAAQAILKALHPNVTYWGSLLRMYGNRSIKDIKQKKQEEQEITQLQSEASLNQPNYAILNKLKEEMLKLKAKREAVKAKGQFILPHNIILPCLSSTDLNKINL